MTTPLPDRQEATSDIRMSDYHTTKIRVEDTSSIAFGKDSTIAIEAAPGTPGLKDNLAETIDTSHHDGLDDAYDRAQREYDASELENGTVIASVEPNGEVHWPLVERSDNA